jgi:hypothetical protein
MIYIFSVLKKKKVPKANKTTTEESSKIRSEVFFSSLGNLNNSRRGSRVLSSNGGHEE